MEKAVLVFTCKELAELVGTTSIKHWRNFPRSRDRLPGGTSDGTSFKGRSRIFRGDYIKLDDSHGYFGMRFVGVSPSGVVWFEHTDNAAKFLSLCDRFDASFDVEPVPAPEWPTWTAWGVNDG